MNEHARHLNTGASRWMRGPVAVLAMATSAYIAFAAISDVGPSAGSVGTVVTISGDGFGTKKPKVTLSNTDSAAAIPLKVTAFADGEISAAVVVTRGKGKLRTGLFDLTVRPSGGGESAVRVGAFSLVGPTQGEVTPSTAAPTASITIGGSNFGTKKGKVSVGGKKAKVTSWTDTEVIATLHKKTPAGAQALTVQNAIGTATVADKVTVSGGGGSAVGGTGGGQLDGYTYAARGLSGGLSGTGFNLTAPVRSVPQYPLYELSMDASNVDLSAVDSRGTIFNPVTFVIRSDDGNTTWTVTPGATVTVAARGARYVLALPDTIFTRSAGTGGAATIQMRDFEFTLSIRDK